MEAIKLTEENRLEIFKDLYDDWAATTVGLTPEDFPMLVDFMKDECGGFKDDANFYHFSGKDMNEVFKLTGDNAYPDDLNLFAVPCRMLANVDKCALPMRQIGMRWFTDIVENNARRQYNEKYVSSIME